MSWFNDTTKCSWKMTTILDAILDFWKSPRGIVRDF